MSTLLSKFSSDDKKIQSNDDSINSCNSSRVNPLICKILIKLFLDGNFFVQLINLAIERFDFYFILLSETKGNPFVMSTCPLLSEIEEKWQNSAKKLNC